MSRVDSRKMQVSVVADALAMSWDAKDAEITTRLIERYICR